jgi:excisionase family DNA binding protein
MTARGRLVTAAAAADMLGVSTRTVKRWAASGRLRRYVSGSGRVVRFREGDVSELLEEVPAWRRRRGPSP